MINQNKNIPNYKIYKLTLNNKIYIGYTEQLFKKRLQQHIYAARCATVKNRDKHTIFSHAIRKYGAENITYEILETVLDPNEAVKREEYYIALYDSTNRDKGYNMLKNSGYPDLSKRNKDFYNSPSYRKKRSDVVKGVFNGRYSGITDDFIIIKAVEYFNKNKHIHILEWFKYCKNIKFPQNYDKKSTFRFNGKGVMGFRENFLQKCKQLNIDVYFEQIICPNSNKKTLIETYDIFKQYYPNNVNNTTIQRLCTTWENREKIKKDEKNKHKFEEKTKKFQEIEQILITEAISFFKQHKHLHFRKWREYRKINNLPQCISHLFDREGEDGFKKQFLKKCIKENIEITVEQLGCIGRMNHISKEKLEKLYYDYYQKIKNETPSI